MAVPEMAASVEELRGALTGDVLEPSDREYERARLCFNLLVDRRPTAIARRLVTTLVDTSTMRAAPVSSMWVSGDSSGIPGVYRTFGGSLR